MKRGAFQVTTTLERDLINSKQLTMRIVGHLRKHLQFLEVLDTSFTPIRLVKRRSWQHSQNHFTTMESPNQPILFLWSMSPWASKVVHYLALRGIPYTQCIQPITMPRPDLAALGVQYRRVPVLAYGRDIYCDTLLILQKFEKWHPHGSKYKSIGAADPVGKAMEHLLEKWTDVAVFASAAAAIPSEMALCKDPQFQKDREELWGRPWTKQEQDRLKPAGLSNLVENFDFLEQLLSDGRQWLLGDDGPGLADVHGKLR